jgi:hypothetical protein
MAEQAPTYTDRTWQADMGAIRDVSATKLAPALEQMLGDLMRLDAGRTQIARMRQCYVMVTELVTEANRILITTAERYSPVNEAQAAAGGLPEVYGDKHAHQAG